MTLAAHPAPLQAVRDPRLERAGVEFLVKRLDLVHPQVSGNKWYKLKYNLKTARQQGHDTLLSFGGAWSNHIHALAVAGRACGFRTIGVIRGDEPRTLTPTLRLARDNGMQLYHLSRADYRRKHSAGIIERLRDRFGAFYLIPEGGSNTEAVRGCAEIITDVEQPFDVIACACGTGGTLAGLVEGLAGRAAALGVAVLKGGGFLYDSVNELLPGERHNWRIELDYHWGGYARSPAALLDFMRDFEARHAIPLEQVYTAKLFYALYDLVVRGGFVRGTTLVALHSGGLQGRLKSTGGVS